MSSPRALRTLAPAIAIAFLSWKARADPDAVEPPSARLDYENASTSNSCPTEPEFRDRVIARLGVDPFVSDADRAVRVALHDDGPRVVARVVLSSVGKGRVLGRRELVVDRAQCNELGESAAVALSIMLDPLGTSAAPRASIAATATPGGSGDTGAQSLREVSPGTSPGAAVATPPVRDEAPSSSATPGARVPRFSLVFGPAMSVGVGPTVTAGARAGAALEVDATSVGAEARIESTPGATTLGRDRAELLLVMGSLVPCHRWLPFRACAFGSLGMTQGEAENVDRPITRRTLVALTGFRAGVAIRITDAVSLEPTIDAALALVRTRFQVGDEIVWTAPLFSTSFALEAHVRVF